MQLGLECIAMHVDDAGQDLKPGAIDPLAIRRQRCDDDTIGAMLDAGIRWRGEVHGVLCLEHIGDARVWSPEELSFATSVADFITLLLESSSRRNTERELVEKLAVIEEQREAINQLSTPVLEVWNQVLVMPIIGVIDNGRRSA